MPHQNRGFTLVEMLVTTALVVLMMLMFAQVFQTAGGLVSNQKGLAENDQSVRTLTTLLRGDIRQRTFVDVVPFVAGQNTSDALTPTYPAKNTTGFDQPNRKGFDAEFRNGFFSISENDASDDTDDVLHLTIRSNTPLSDNASLPYFAKARLLRAPGGFPADNDQYLLANPDQPEYDDGQSIANNTGASGFGEVCWFLRHGKLYRRFLLIRDRYNPGDNTSSPDEPRDNTDAELIGSFYDHDLDGTPDEFWKDFDYSAYWHAGEGVKFHTNPESLVNSSIDNTGFGGLPRSLGNPLYRFGSSTNRLKGGAIFPPREYITEGTQRRFIGRFTVQETCDPDFRYPGGFTSATDFAQNDPFNFTPPTMGPVNPFANPPGQTQTLNTDMLADPYDDSLQRRGEDIVMSNVHAFDVQVWDAAINGFVNLGHNQMTSGATPVEGWFHNARNRNPEFGNRFDTWHPHQDMPQFPPFAPFGVLPLTGQDPPTPADELAQRFAAHNSGLGHDGEIWLKAILVKVRFYDAQSEQMRDLTFSFPLNREQIENR